MTDDRIKWRLTGGQAANRYGTLVREKDLIEALNLLDETNQKLNELLNNESLLTKDESEE